MAGRKQFADLLVQPLALRTDLLKLFLLFQVSSLPLLLQFLPLTLREEYDFRSTPGGLLNLHRFIREKLNS